MCFEKVIEALITSNGRQVFLCRHDCYCFELIKDEELYPKILNKKVFCTNREPAEAKFKTCLDEPLFKAKLKFTINLTKLIIKLKRSKIVTDFQGAYE